jgi:hypothetical protein
MRPTGNCRPALADLDVGFFLASPFLSPTRPLAPLPDRPLAPFPDMAVAVWVVRALCEGAEARGLC